MGISVSKHQIMYIGHVLVPLASLCQQRVEVRILQSTPTSHKKNSLIV
jgi:hypothetical protein